MIESLLVWFFAHLFSDLGFILAFIFIVHLLRSDKSPASTFAWLLFVLLIPYLGVPFYILFGGRKMRRMTESKKVIWPKEKNNAVKNNELPGGISGLFQIREKTVSELLLTGEAAYSAIIEKIKLAKKHICISTFIFGDDETGRSILKELIVKEKEGVEVYLLIDALGGSFLSRTPDFHEFKKLGGEVAFFMPMIHWPFRGRANLRNHRKIFLVDGREAIMGGMNIASEYMSLEKHEKQWRDLCVILEGDVVEDLYQVFRSDWEFASKSKLKLGLDVEGDIALKEERAGDFQLVPSGPDVEGDPLHESVLSLIFNAEKSITIVTPYFIPDDLLFRALCIVSRKGVRVKLIVPNRSNHPVADLARGSLLRTLEESGVQVFRYLPGMLHGKLITIDDDLSIVGSANMDMRSLFLNYEIALFIHSKDKQKELEKWSSDLIQESELGTQKTSYLHEFLEDLSRLLSPLL